VYNANPWLPLSRESAVLAGAALVGDRPNPDGADKMVIFVRALALEKQPNSFKA
jgi:hypothetical protein